MRIYSKEYDKVFNDLLLFLTDEELVRLDSMLKEEEGKLFSSLELLGTDIHELLTKKLTIKVYDESNLVNHNERTKKIILENK